MISNYDTAVHSPNWKTFYSTRPTLVYYLTFLVLFPQVSCRFLLYSSTWDLWRSWGSTITSTGQLTLSMRHHLLPAWCPVIGPRWFSPEWMITPTTSRVDDWPTFQSSYPPWQPQCIIQIVYIPGEWIARDEAVVARSCDISRLY